MDELVQTRDSSWHSCDNEMQNWAIFSGVSIPKYVLIKGTSYKDRPIHHVVIEDHSHSQNVPTCLFCILPVLPSQRVTMSMKSKKQFPNKPSCSMWILLSYQRLPIQAQARRSTTPGLQGFQYQGWHPGSGSKTTPCTASFEN